MKGDSFTPEDLRFLVRTLHDARAKWKHIATQLKLSENDVECIAMNCQNDPTECFKEMLNVWLKGLSATREELAQALASPTVAKYDLAKEIFPDVKLPPQKRGITNLMVYFIWIPLLILLIAYWFSTSTMNPSESLSSLSSSINPSLSSSLPLIKKRKLIGRKKEMGIIMNYLMDKEVDVVTLYGQAGFGKSEIALHIGHKMTKMGADVYYIKVEEIEDIDGLERKLMAISEASFTDEKLMKWATSLTKETLLILDNVDGPHWIGKKSRQQFQSKFVDVLQQHSSLLKVLITSQEIIHSAFNFQSHKLGSLSQQNCVQLVNTLVTPDPNVPQSEVLCTLVGKVPMAIKVLTKILSPNYPMSDVIERLNETISSKKLKFLADSGDRVDKDRIISAIELTFNVTKLEYQVCSLLLVKLPGSFSLNTSKLIVTSEMMEDLGFSNFYINDCLYELTSKSFIEQISTNPYPHTEVKEMYHFHILIRDFLNMWQRHNITKVLDNFWRNYLDWFESLSGGEWFFYDVSKEDLKALTIILYQNDSHSYYLATILCSSTKLLIFRRAGLRVSMWNDAVRLHHYESLLQAAGSVLLSDCEKPVLNIHNISIPKIINAYINTFEYLVCYHDPWNKDSVPQDCTNNLVQCQPKIEQLHLAAKGSHEAMEASSYFHNNLVEPMCQHTQSTHSICSHVWKYRLLGLAHVLVSVKEQCPELSSNSSKEIVDPGYNIAQGLKLFALAEDDAAVHHLHLALQDDSSCKQLHDAVVYITLYVIHSRQGNQQGMEDSVTGVVETNFQHANMTCYLSIYGDTVISFLRQVNETTSAELLTDIRRIGFLSASDSTRTDYLMNIEYGDHFRKPVRDARMKMLLCARNFTLKANTSLFCLISRDVVEGCESPLKY